MAGAELKNFVKSHDLSDEGGRSEQMRMNENSVSELHFMHSIVVRFIEFLDLTASHCLSRQGPSLYAMPHRQGIVNSFKRAVGDIHFCTSNRHRSILTQTKGEKDTGELGIRFLLEISYQSIRYFGPPRLTEKIPLP